MAQTAASIWDWSLAVLPITAFITFLVTIIACNLVLNYGSGGSSLLPVSHIATGNAYVYFLAGFVLLLPQILAIIIGRLQFLLQTQGLINSIFLYIIHIISFIPLIFMIIVTFISQQHRSNAYLLITYGILGSIALYCLLHTIIVFYLYIRRANGSKYSKITLPIWFLSCSLLMIVFFVLWFTTNSVIIGYIVAVTPFLYFLGYVPQFWARARSRKLYNGVSKVEKAFHTLKK